MANAKAEGTLHRVARPRAPGDGRGAVSPTTLGTRYPAALLRRGQSNHGSSTPPRPLCFQLPGKRGKESPPRNLSKCPFLPLKSKPKYIYLCTHVRSGHPARHADRGHTAKNNRPVRCRPTPPCTPFEAFLDSHLLIVMNLRSRPRSQHPAATTLPATPTALPTQWKTLVRPKTRPTPKGLHTQKSRESVQPIESRKHGT